eukprot:COSAG06_NODE_4254_length_4427_cov_105.219270_1_plen_79_part_00
MRSPRGGQQRESQSQQPAEIDSRSERRAVASSREFTQYSLYYNQLTPAAAVSCFCASNTRDALTHRGRQCDGGRGVPS